MTIRLWFCLFATVLLIGGCAPIPQAAVPASTPAGADVSPAAPPADTPAPAPAPTTMPATPVPTATEPAPPTDAPAAAATEAPTPADGWQTYTNEVGFSVSYPPGWMLTEQPADASQPMQGATLEGPEGALELQWGTGFGGACMAYSVVHAAQGQLSACHSLLEDGSHQWVLGGRELAEVTFGGRAFTKDASQASIDAVLAVLATLTFEAPPEPAVTAAAGEIIVDNAGPDFWPSGDWYILQKGQPYGQDCYEALPGLMAGAEVRPQLAQAGLYEVFAWSCGDPRFANARNGIIEVHRSNADPAPQAVGVNYQANPAVWLSLGTYNLQEGAFLKVRSTVEGSVVADAYRFVLQTTAGAETVPTPLPTGPIVSNHPPPPETQATAGDLAARLALTNPWYQPVTITGSQMSFDDCQAFPREGCDGTRDGFQAIVGYEGITMTYRMSSDYQLVGIRGVEQLDPWTLGQEHPQRVFLRGLDGGRVFYYPNGTWRYLRYAADGLPQSDVPLTREQAQTLQSLAARYGTARIPASGSFFTFYGLGQTVAPTGDDRMALTAVADALAAMPR